MKIIVTGGAGFIASHIADAYIETGHEVVILDNLSTGSKENVNAKARLIEADITSSDLADIISSEKPDLINHHAAQINVRVSVDNPRLDANTNILGTINLLEAAKKSQVKKIIMASTGGAIYGDTDQIPTPETLPAWPVSPYGIGKLTGEHYMHYYREIFGLPFISLRYGNVYGPRQNPHGEAGVVAIFFQRLLSGQEFNINGDGEQTRDFVFVGDVVKANLAATETDISDIFNIGTGIETSVNKLVDTMKQAINYSDEISHADAKPGEQQRSCLDASKARQQLNWTPQTDLAEGIKQTAEYFKEQARGEK